MDSSQATQLVEPGSDCEPSRTHRFWSLCCNWHVIWYHRPKGVLGLTCVLALPLTPVATLNLHSAQWQVQETEGLINT